MPLPQKGYPLAVVVDFLIGYLKYKMFSNPLIAPTTWRYVSGNQRQSAIRISAPFVIDNQKPLSQPFVVVERGDFSFKDSVVDDLKGADKNTMDNEQKVLFPTGVIMMTCGSRSAAEASSLANFLVLIINSSKSSICKGSQFIRQIKCVNVGPEIPTYFGHTVQRYEVTLAIQTGIQFGYTYVPYEEQQFNKFSVRAVKKPYELNGETGEVTVGSPIFTDNNVKFGEDILFDSKELSDNWYQVKLIDSPEYQLVVDSINYEPAESWGYSINLKIRGEDGSFTPWEPESDSSDLRYSITWNQVHLFFSYPSTEPFPEEEEEE